MTKLELLLSQDDYCLVSIASVKRALKQEPTTQERQAESDRFDAAFQDGYNNGYAQARFDYEQEPTTNSADYRRAFKIACDLLNGDILYGVDTDKIYELMMQKDDVVSSSSYEEYILNHLQELDQGQYITENCIACKYDETEEEDGEHCKKCLVGDSQFELDKEFVQPTIKNDLVVDCIDRQATLDAIIKRLGIKNETYLLEAERAIYQQILAMPSVTPQLSSELEKNSKKLEKDFGELDCISRADAIRVASGYCHPSNVANELAKLPSVTPQEPRWIPVSERLPEANIYDGHGPVWKHEVLITGYLSYDDKKETFVNMAFAEDVRNKCVPNTNVTAWMPLPKAYREVEE